MTSHQPRPKVEELLCMAPSEMGMGQILALQLYCGETLEALESARAEAAKLKRQGSLAEDCLTHYIVTRDKDGMLSIQRKD